MNWLVLFQVQRDFTDILQPYFQSDGIVLKTLEFAKFQDHIMDFTKMRALNSLFSLINQGARNVLNYNQQHQDFPLSAQQVEQYVVKYLVYSLVWCMSGDSKFEIRNKVSDYIRNITTIQLPPSNSLIIDYEVRVCLRYK